MKIPVILLAWFFSVTTAGITRHLGPYVTQVQCEQMRQHMIAQQLFETVTGCKEQ